MAKYKASAARTRRTNVVLCLRRVVRDVADRRGGALDDAVVDTEAPTDEEPDGTKRRR